MGKQWDYDVPTIEFWRMVLRKLKPGGYLLSFGGTRTYHRMVVNIEDAGFEIRDQIQWIYGSGFPKSHNVSKAIDKLHGAKREVVGSKLGQPGMSKDGLNQSFDSSINSYGAGGVLSSDITAPATDDAKAWDGWGTALKPANEPIVVARKPLSEKTVAKNVLKWGTGAMNIDASRVGDASNKPQRSLKDRDGKKSNGKMLNGVKKGLEAQMEINSKGRFPANVILDEQAGAMLDAQSGVLKSGLRKLSDKVGKEDGKLYNYGRFGERKAIAAETYGDSGGASRFFYCPKSSKRERNAGLEGMPLVAEGVGDPRPSGQSMQRLDGREARQMQNHHPTVKPIKLMQYLINLVTPPGGTVLDPFMGSGTTGVAAKELGFDFVGIERDAEYFEIAKRRVGD